MKQSREEKNAVSRKYYSEHKEQQNASSKRYAQQHKEELNTAARKRYAEKRDADPNFRKNQAARLKKWKAENPETFNASRNAWRKRNPGYSTAYQKARIERDPNFAILLRVRSRINHIMWLARKTGVKSADTITLLGCSVGDYMTYLEDRFASGMTWGNRRLWHIDHVKALAKFDLTDPAQQAVAFHYTNTQPLWKLDNLRKGARELQVTDTSLTVMARSRERLLV